MKILSKRQILMICATVVFAVVFVITFTLSWFLVDEEYKIDLESIKTKENLIWWDEFDGNAIDTDNWRIEPSGNFDGTKYGEPIVRKGGLLGIEPMYC